MATDMNQISLKNGGKFAMSWVAGTNPKALRSKSQQCRIYSVNITQVCEEIIECFKTKQNAFTFRLLFRLCFGTIHIYSEQVKHLYNVTLNFVFALKQCSRKRLMSSSVYDGSKNKRRRTASTEFIMKSLLHESENSSKNVEESFEFFNETLHKTSTCIQIKEITIRHVNWDIPMPDDEDAFGDASLEDLHFLLSGFNGTADNFRSSLKRKASYGTTEASPFKRPCLLNESREIVRYDPSTQNDTISEASFYLNQIKAESEKSITDVNNNDLTQTDLDATFEGTLFEDQQTNDQSLNNLQNCCPAIKESNETPLPDVAEDCIIDNTTRTDVHNIVDSNNEIESPISPILSEVIPPNSVSKERKRKGSQLIIDIQTKIQKTDFDNIWKYCFEIGKADHLASVKKPMIPIVFNKRIIRSRVQSHKLLTYFNKNVKYGLKRSHDDDRQHLLDEILGHEFETYANLFKIKRPKKTLTNYQAEQQQVEVEKQLNLQHSEIDENNNNSIKIEEPDPQPVNTVSESNGCQNNNSLSEFPGLKNSLSEIDPHAISFDFPKKDENDRSQFRKEEIMKKLLIAWRLDCSKINMNTFIDGGNRVKAAAVFSTLLDLAGQNYIEIVKNEANSIESIKMGPKTILLMATKQ